MYNLDISLLRTFLEVNRTRHFGKAAENLYLTQSAVSARIKQLEEILSVELFQRFRNNLQLTPQGERLISYAEQILLSWTLAVQDVSLPASTEQLVIAAPQSAWDAQLFLVPIELLKSMDTLHIRTESLDSRTILRHLQERTLDLGFLFDQPKVEEIIHQRLPDIELQLYSSTKQSSLDDLNETNYVLVDWGQGFAALHAREFPEIRSPKLYASDWKMAVEYLKTRDGFAFLPKAFVENIETTLYPVKNAPIMRRELYVCYHYSKPKQSDWENLMQLINQIFQVAD